LRLPDRSLVGGKELEGLAIWRDANQDGVSQDGEVRSLADWGVVAISIRHVTGDEDPSVLASSESGVMFVDGSTRPTFDLLLYER